jgi:hypothetical protein
MLNDNVLTKMFEAKERIKSYENKINILNRIGQDIFYRQENGLAQAYIALETVKLEELEANGIPFVKDDIHYLPFVPAVPSLMMGDSDHPMGNYAVPAKEVHCFFSQKLIDADDDKLSFRLIDFLKKEYALVVRKENIKLKALAKKL